MTFQEWLTEELDSEQIGDLIEYGAAGGFPGLTYYSDTGKLYEEHKDEIWDALFEDAENQGLSIPALVGTFGGAENVGSHAQFENLLVWYMAERTAFQLVEEVS